jgi:hypothetical protein
VNIFPVNSFFRPDIRHKGFIGKHFLAEIKRSCPLVHQEAKIKQFVKFYNELLGPGKTNLRLDRTPRLIQDAINDPTTVLLFVFNREDSTTVEDTMRRKIEKMTRDKHGKIESHPVITVWCNSADLIKWREILEKDREILDKGREILEKDLVIESLKRQLTEIDNENKSTRKKVKLS